MKLFLGLLFLTPLAWAAMRPLPIPRTATNEFRIEGLFEGGTNSPANIESLTLSEQSTFERWTLDFSDHLKREIGKVAPRFQLRYIPGDKIIGSDGVPILIKPAKFILTFRSIRKNRLNRAALQEMVRKSKYVKDIIVYPPIEEGDTALEFILNDNVAFDSHQPAQKAGRLVLDLKQAPAQKF